MMPITTEPLSDDDIQFLSLEHPNKVLCQICGKDLSAMTLPQKENHYEHHFPESNPQPPKVTSHLMSGGAIKPSKPLSKTFKPDPRSPEPHAKPKSGLKGQSIVFRKSPEYKNIFWHSSQTTEPPPNFTPGLITVLKKALTRLHDRGLTQRAWLAFEYSMHVHSEMWDKSWGCGYRNYLVACAALMDQQMQPMYFPLLDAPAPPGILNLQNLVERAWRDGYDEEGANQLQYKLVDTNRWIGTGELYVAFTYRGIPAQLVDFDLKDGVGQLLQWVHDYFSDDEPQGKMATVSEALRGARPVIVTNKLPIILQHQGHSRTIVGCEQAKNGAIHLLTFDPARKVPVKIRNAALQYHNPARIDGASGSSIPSKALEKVKHAVENIRLHKRKSPNPDPGPSKKKRVDDNDIIVIKDDDDSDDKKSSSGQPQRPQGDILDPVEVVKEFRVNPKQLNKHRKYQILYFPLDEPLTDAQKAERRIVCSEKVF